MSGGIRKTRGGTLKGGTSSSRRNRFESFNQRISKIKIDPIRRSQPPDAHHPELSLESSYFKIALERWKDLNVSANFTNFAREVQPQCDSLPQLIHHHEDIMSKLICFIEKRDTLSLEPLLDLLASFAHDLGTRFETHFGPAVTLVASLAATHPDVEVIEWSFMCLAWLFKYLSRLLVSDLRPLYDIMAPLLGKERQKSHTTQFAAEAMSFLIRKAAIQYHRDKALLDLIVSYTIGDFGCFEAHDDIIKLYQGGLMALYVETIKGIDRKVHSSGAHVFCCLLEHVLEATGSRQGRTAELAYGVAVGLIHLADALGFRPILETILEQVQKLDRETRDANIAICARLLFVASTVRKGSRIADWQPVLDALQSLLGLCDTASDATFLQIYKAAVVVLQTSPLEIVIPHIHPALEVFTHKRHAHHFLAFCIDFHDLNPEHFHSLIFPSFSK